MSCPTTTPNPARDAAQVGAELMAVLAALRRLTRRRLRAAAGTPGRETALRGTQLELLQLVEVEPGVGVAAAARGLHLAGNSVSTMVNQLVEAGWLRRDVDPADRRAVRLHLSEQAHERLAGWRAARGALLGDAMDRLPEIRRAEILAALPALHQLITELEEAS
jgi:DNA-binding MarR family transcriptional regulator